MANEVESHFYSQLVGYHIENRTIARGVRQFFHSFRWFPLPRLRPK